MAHNVRVDVPSDPAAWPLFAAGDRMIVVKRSPDGAEAARYPARVIAQVEPDAWLVVRATWTYLRVDLDGLSFCPGDELIEWFSPAERFNAFAVHAPDGSFKGWYANVTDPARCDATTEPPVLEWRDLYVDLVGLPDGTYTIRDEDELSASDLERRDPRLYAEILKARNELVARFQRGACPFVHAPQSLVHGR